jgi:hypothetical protein
MPSIAPVSKAKVIWISICLTCMVVLSTWGSTVAPNPLSLLKHKRVLLIDPTDPTDYHKQPRIILTGKINQIKTAVGFDLTQIKGVDTMTLPALNRFDIVIFNYYMKLELLENKPFGIAFKQWLMQGGHGVIGYHNSGSQSSGQWNWYRDSVQSMRYIDHKDGAQKGTVNMTSDSAIRKLPILSGMDAQFTGVDEWYSFDMPPKAPAAPTWPDCKVLYYMDESSVAQLTDKMGIHPATWIREDAKKNRFFYTIHIHSDDGANSDFFHSLIQRALEYVSGYQSAASLENSERFSPRVFYPKINGNPIHIFTYRGSDPIPWSITGRNDLKKLYKSGVRK